MADFVEHKTYKNTRFQILTQKGFKNFDGIMIGTNPTVITIQFENITLKCTPKHKILITDTNYTYAQNLKIGDIVYGGLRVTSIEVSQNDNLVYDLLNVHDTHSYYTNGILSHQCLVIDECAFIEPHLMEPFWASVFPIVSSSKKSKVFMCSTPNGTGNLFYDIYTGAVDGTNGWAYSKILWNDIPGRDEKWAKEIKSGLASEEKWRQEFEAEFINSGTSSLDETLYENMVQRTMEPLEVLMDGRYRIFDLPNPNKIYVAGVDVAEGVGGDASVVKVYDMTDLNEILEVAEFHDNRTPVAEFSNIVYEILGHWGRPPVCIERNNQGGQVADRLGIDLGYDKIVSWGGKLAGRKNLQLLGMISSRNTKIHACANARYYYSDRRALVMRDKNSLDELFKDFVKQPNDSWAAVSGKHDDRTMAMIWAFMVLDKDICEDFFSIEEIDECGKVLKLGPLDNGVDLFTNATSIYTNEHVDAIEHSHLAPIGFNMFGSPQDSEISSLMADGWKFVNGASSFYNDPERDISPDMWNSIDKWFG